MKFIPRILTGMAVLLAAAIVFSPFVAALVGTGLEMQSLAAAFLTVWKPLARSALTGLVERVGRSPAGDALCVARRADTTGTQARHFGRLDSWS